MALFVSHRPSVTIPPHNPQPGPSQSSSQHSSDVPEPIAATKIPRPMNSWLLFRTQRLRELKQQNPNSRVPQAILSKMISELWRNELPYIKRGYEKQAEQCRIDHELKYPAYKYQRRVKSDKPVKRRSAIKTLPPPQTAAPPASPAQSNNSSSSEEVTHRPWVSSANSQTSNSQAWDKYSGTPFGAQPTYSTDQLVDETSCFDIYPPRHAPSYHYPAASYEPQSFSSWNSAIHEEHDLYKNGIHASPAFYTQQNVWAHSSYIAPPPSWSARTSFASSCGEEEVY